MLAVARLRLLPLDACALGGEGGDQGLSSTGRAFASKAKGSGFDSLRSCQMRSVAHR